MGTNRRRRTGTAVGVVVALLLTVMVVAAPPAAAGQMASGWYAPLSPLPGSSTGFLANDCGHPGYGSFHAGAFHIGRDLPRPSGSSVYAVGDGTVVYAGSFGSGVPGKVIFVQHVAGDGTPFQSMYGHVNLGVANGAHVKAGQRIGTLVNQGSNSHLHFGITVGRSHVSSGWGERPCSAWPDAHGFVDPLPFLAAHPVAAPAPTPTCGCAGAGDFDGDGRDDVLWYAPGAATDRLWSGSATRGSFALTENPSGGVTRTYTPIPGDFDGDGRDDVLWYAPGAATDRLWSGTATRGSFALTENPSGGVTRTYTPIRGDFDGDGRGDVLWYAPGAALDRLWSGTATRGSFALTDDPSSGVTRSYTPIPGDFDGDGKDDILWYAPGAATDRLWSGTATRGSFTALDAPNGGVTGTYVPIPGDFDGDGKDDVLWYAPGAAADRLWSGTATKGSFTKSEHPNGGVLGTYAPIPGDFDGDGKDDVFWYAPGAATDRIWFGTATKSAFAATDSPNGHGVSGTYRPVGAA